MGAATAYFRNIYDTVRTIAIGMRITLKYCFARTITLQYPDMGPAIQPRYRGFHWFEAEKCIACDQCAKACPVDCISLQAAEDEHGRRYPEFFRINFSRCIFCGFCEEACPTYAIQLTPDFEMGEYVRQNLVYEKEHLLINGPGKYPGYNFYRVAGLSVKGKNKGEAENEEPPVDVKDLMP